ncbi:MAG TPA: SRPBCC family protein [Solirubrobacteraceae bacterium]|nr:SRPBCC family protein [Solirubrobacteraceae bacterium]
MATARKSRTIAASPERIWEVVGDPHHFPRWWPGVVRMEGVGPSAFTQVFMTKKGRAVRVDFRVLESEAERRHSWEQEITGTPFERVLTESITNLTLEPAESGTRVTVEQQQRLKGYSKTGGLMLRRATNKRLDEALATLEQLFQ